MLQQFAVEHEAMYIPSLASSGGRVGQQENFLACSFDPPNPPCILFCEYLEPNP